jgi:hypothetical protein
MVIRRATLFLLLMWSRRCCARWTDGCRESRCSISVPAALPPCLFGQDLAIRFRAAREGPPPLSRRLELPVIQNLGLDLAQRSPGWKGYAKRSNTKGYLQLYGRPK